MKVYERINKLLSIKKMTKKDFIEKFIALEPLQKNTGDVPSVPTVYSWLNGRGTIAAEMIPYMAKVLGVDADDLVGTNKKRNCYAPTSYGGRIREISFVSDYVEEKRDRYEGKKEDSIIVDRNILPKKYANTAIGAMRVDGDSMSPYVNDGDIVLFAPIYENNFSRIDGKYILETQSGLIVKNVKFNILDSGYIIASENPAYPPEKITQDSLDSIVFKGIVVARFLKN
jgi:transcriptional regulator with XRE-family HTH domain